MRILGIDPGLNTTGYGVLEFAHVAASLGSTTFTVGRDVNSSLGETRPRGPRLVEAGVVRSKASGSLAERVKEIHTGVADVIAGLKPEVLAITVSGMSIMDICELSIDEAIEFFDHIDFTEKSCTLPARS